MNSDFETILNDLLNRLDSIFDEDAKAGKKLKQIESAFHDAANKHFQIINLLPTKGDR